MKINYPLQSKETKENVIKTKFVFVGFVLMLAFALFVLNCIKVSAAGITETITLGGTASNVNVVINGTKYEKYTDKDNSAVLKAVELTGYTDTSGNNPLTFIQSNGASKEVEIHFTITNFPSGATAFMIVESQYSDSSDHPDADRYIYEKSYIQKDDGVYLRVGNLFYEMTDANTYADASCTALASEATDVKYLKYRGNSCVEIIEDNRYDKTDAEGWVGSVTNDEYGSVTVTNTGAVKVVYRLRTAGFGMKYFRIVFYRGEIASSSPSSYMDINFIVSNPIDVVGLSNSNNIGACAGNDNEICIEYSNEGITRESQPLNIYIPSSVAYDYKVVSKEDALVQDPTNDNKFKYQIESLSSIYAINYFTEVASDTTFEGVLYKAGETIADYRIKSTAGANYLYTNFEKGTCNLNNATLGDDCDTQEVTDWLVKSPQNANFGSYLNQSANTLKAIEMEVDASGAYYFYIIDIFGNVTETIYQEVTNVKNRSIETIVKKGNAKVEGTTGYDAEENFTNESVKITLDMTVKTNYEFGQCINNKCTSITILNAGNISKIQFWRVDVEVDPTNGDLDAFDDGDTTAGSPKNNYASKDYAANGTIYDLYCKSSCTTTDYSNVNARNEDGFGAVGFEGNTFVMYVALSGRYRFYIEDTAGGAGGSSGNNTWGREGDLMIGEYRNPRVEVYAIDKTAPTITFDHEDKTADSLTKFDVETYEYYRGIGVSKNESGKFVYDARSDKEDEPKEITIDSAIYYNENRDNEGAADIDFDDAQAIEKSKVFVTDMLYGYSGTNIKYAEFDGSDSSYETGLSSNDRTTIIKNNIKSNSNGLKLNADDEFEFVSIHYLHNDGTAGVCEQIISTAGREKYEEIIEGLTTDKAIELRCVNYYIDHGVDFIIEFTVQDALDNQSSGQVYVEVVDTTPAGFNDHTNKIKATNVKTEYAEGETICRMEVGQTIGSGKNQTAEEILDCYNVIVEEVYKFEDNVYDKNNNSGLKFFNRINSYDYVDLFIYDDSYNKIDLKTGNFTPNKTGYYDLEIVINDGNGNYLTVQVSYYVDKKIVLIEPIANDKNYGEADKAFDYCVYIDKDNNVKRFSGDPYADMSIYTAVYCTKEYNGVSGSEEDVLGANADVSSFSGALSRIESSWYNKELDRTLEGGSVGIENNYVGEYNIILGTLNINKKTDDSKDENYIVKIHKLYRSQYLYQDKDGVLITEANKETKGKNDISVAPESDDDSFAQSTVMFTIKQVVVNVSAIGGNKNYGSTDDNYENYNDDDAANKYLNGYEVDADTLKNDGLHYNDTASIVLGVLRREVGENVGLYLICNYRGEIADTTHDSYNMYEGCGNVSTTFDFTDESSFTYSKGVLVIEEAYIKSRALYVAANEFDHNGGKTMNSVAAVDGYARDHKHANYLINYTGANYQINAIDLIIQAAPGQRREYNANEGYLTDPNPWEIILYGLQETYEIAESGFNGYTANHGNYENTIDLLDKVCDDETKEACYQAKLETNKSEDRGNNWKYKHGDNVLTGEKLNDSYSLLRSVASGSEAGSGKLVREGTTVRSGGWYDFYGLANDEVVGANASNKTETSLIAVITNGKKNCSYDVSGHQATVSTEGSEFCKNYNLVYGAYYTDLGGYHKGNMEDGKTEASYVYKSTGITSEFTCMNLDPDLPCYDSSVDGEDVDKKYRITFEIYRREIILEFNSSIAQIQLYDANATPKKSLVEVMYGYRYNFYKDNFFSMDYYYSADGSLKGESIGGITPEDYLFYCYKAINDGEGVSSGYDSGNATGSGCTGNPRYGLTDGDTWKKIGLKFELHSLVSSTYGIDSQNAIPAGVYFVYSSIDSAQERNYNYKYQGGTLTVRSKPIGITITSYVKEYGEPSYSRYGAWYEGIDYNELTSFANGCVLEDGQIINGGTTLINLDCMSENNEVGNMYGFQIVGLDSKDSLKNNFIGRPDRNKSASVADDLNGLQDIVGVYQIFKGSIEAYNVNPFLSNKSCGLTAEPSQTNCVVVSGSSYQHANYVTRGEERTYLYDLLGDNNDTVTVYYSGSEPEAQDKYTYVSLDGLASVTNGKLFITPATLTIEVATGQTKMFGCAYNAHGTDYGYKGFEAGYANCEDGVGDYYDLGYQYSVYGDKDYHIANNGYDANYSDDEKYVVNGVSRPTNVEYGNSNKPHGLNSGGVLYRVLFGSANTTLMKSDQFAFAGNATANGGKTQGQSVGNYVITLGSVNAALNEAVSGVAACDDNNKPAVDGANLCRNYDINYYSEELASYDGNADSFPSDLYFTISARTVYMYTDYDSKIYGEVDPDITYKCGENNGVANRVCGSDDEVVEMGITKYFAKTHSLAVSPWNGDDSVSDYQTKVVIGKISRKGMGDDNPGVDDVKGYYEYRYADKGGTVGLTEYGRQNYNINYYYKNGLAVNEDGENTSSITIEGVTDEYPVMFEIVLRRIKIKFISFNKVYGEHDVVTDYDILVCAPSQEFVQGDDGKWSCGEAASDERHGLSTTHRNEYIDSDGSGWISEDKLEAFKEAFKVRYQRVLGENVSCGTTDKKVVKLSGFFFGVGSDSEGINYEVTLTCKSGVIEDDEDKLVYETLAYIDQGAGELGYNYEVSYETGYVNITKRPIMITPDEGQGFMYGNYHGTLIPAITFTDAVKSTANTVNSYGLVNGGEDGSLCLKNIDYYNNGVSGGTCFYINDRQNEYDEYSHMTTTANPTINSQYGLASFVGGAVVPYSNQANYVFGDKYQTEQSDRMALNRTIGSNVNSRYDRNVGTYRINLGELGETEFDNYTIELTTDEDHLSYIITPATVVVTPEDDQYKIYGEYDEEIKFDVTTEYSVTDDYYLKKNEYIAKVYVWDGESGEWKNLVSSGKTKYNYSAADYSFTLTNTNGDDYTHFLINKGDKIKLNGFAYGENNGSAEFNYGANKDNQKLNNQTIQQNSSSSYDYYDKFCRGSVNEECVNKKVQYVAPTNKILLGYLYVDEYNQNAGVHNIKSGIVIADNAHGKKNYTYNKSDSEGKTFTVIPRPAGVQVNSITKTYGEATDNASCDDGVAVCAGKVNSLHTNFTVLNNEVGQNTLLKAGVENILGINKSKYMQGELLINGIPTAKYNETDYYTADGTADSNASLKVYVSRDELNAAANCMFKGDKHGMCEDVGTYPLRLYGYANTIDTLLYRPNRENLEATDSVYDYYYGGYFGYNPNYFIVAIGENSKVVNPTATPSQQYEREKVATTARDDDSTESLLVSTGKLVINRKEIAIYVNTHFIDTSSQEEIYYIEQNSNPPTLPSINNGDSLDYDLFGSNRSAAVGTDTYGTTIWGDHNTGVRTNDKLVGTLAYCDKILTEIEFNNGLLSNGLDGDYGECSELLYEAQKDQLNTNLPGYIPIVREKAKLSIINTGTVTDGSYEDLNYKVKFYPGALRVEIDDTKPVVQVNRSDVYIEANAVGTYSYDCVGKTGTTTYTSTDDCGGISVVGDMDPNAEDAILKWLRTNGRDTIKTISEGNIVAVIAGALPMIENCAATEHECTASALFQMLYGKGNASFNSSGGIKPGVDAKDLVAPFAMQTASADSTTPHSRNELINALVEWFGVTAYDLGEIRNGTPLKKVFDKYWFVIIENNGVDSEGQGTTFEIDRVGSYKVHFYVMDNAGNVSQGNVNAEAYYEIKASNRYKLENGNYVQDNNGNYLKVSSYLPITKENLYVYSNGSYEANENGTYLLYDGKYYNINAYRRYAKDGDDYKLNAEGMYMELHASYYLIKTDNVYISNGDGSYTKTASITNGSYLQVGKDYNNTATLHIIDTTKPTVGTINLYSGQVECLTGDCSFEDNWLVAQDTYVPVNVLLRYDSNGNPYTADDDEYFVDIGGNSLIAISSLTKYDVNHNAIGNNVVAGAKYVLIPKGNKARALKHYTWTNQDIYMTITGGSDNSYTDSAQRSGVEVKDWRADISQWDHYYSRDGGITWFLYNRTSSSSVLASAQEGIRKIITKAVDKGVKLTSDISAADYKQVKTYIVDYYSEGNYTTKQIDTYKFTDSFADNAFLYEIDLKNITDLTADDISGRYNTITGDNFGWNISDAAGEDKDMSNKISMLIYGKKAVADPSDPGGTEYTGYTYNRDIQYAYYDVTKPTVNIGGSNGEKLYLFEYGCSTLTSCKKGYEELYATTNDSQGNKVREAVDTTKRTEVNISTLITGNEYEIIGENGYDVLYSEILTAEAGHGGLSTGKHLMSGTNENISIQNIYEKDRIYVIYEFKVGENREDYDRSKSMINDVIPTTTENYTGDDVTYTVIYSVIDKAGNESTYVARGVIFADLIPEIQLVQNEVESINSLEVIDDKTYKLNVEQGTDVDAIIQSLNVDATIKSGYLTQTIRYNGELVVDNVRYDPNIYEGFTTDNPGVYEITYNLQYRYYGQNGESEMISAEPLKLILSVETAQPSISSTNAVNYQNIILLISLLTSAMFIVMLGIFGKKEFRGK